MRISYYDIVLGLIPTASLITSGFLRLMDIEYSIAIPAGASISILVIAHALFINGPTIDIDNDVIDHAQSVDKTVNAPAIESTTNINEKQNQLQ